MATYKAIANGNADTLSIWEIWDGSAWVAASILPGESDDVYTNGFIVTVTTSQSYKSWNRSSVAAPYNITQGGQFQIDGANDILISGEINGTNVTQQADNGLSACVNRLATHIGTMSIVGNQNGGSGKDSYGFFNNSTYEITSIIGNQNGGSGHASIGFYNKAAATFTSIVGNQQGGSTYSYGFLNIAASTTFTSIVGNQQGGSVGNSFGFWNNAAGSIITFENSFQKTGAYPGVYNSGDSTTINFINCRAYVNSIYNTKSTTTINFQGITYNDLQDGMMAIKSLGNVNFDLSVFYIGLTPTYTDIALYPVSTLENPPATTDVRSGVVYGIGDAYEGVCAVPPPASVALNVPVDNTVGELVTATTPADFIAALKADDLGQRLSKVATLEELMGILTSLLK